MAGPLRSGHVRTANETMRLIITAFVGIVVGFFLGISFPALSPSNINFPTTFLPSIDLSYAEDKYSGLSTQALLNAWSTLKEGNGDPSRALRHKEPKIWVKTNPSGAERLPPGILQPQTDLYLHRLWGRPEEDLTHQPKYLVTFTVGYEQKENIDSCVKKFSDNFQIMLFHYDGRTSEWDEFEWSKRAIHVSVHKQTKWWYAKRFLHPDIVAAYDYIFIWDEDLGVEHFDAEKYLELVKKHGLEISQPGLEPNRGLTWQMTKRRGETEMHKVVNDEKPGWCSDELHPPCAAFIEIMAPVFSKAAWRCVWHMIQVGTIPIVTRNEKGAKEDEGCIFIFKGSLSQLCCGFDFQNDLVHGWGLDFALRRCVEPAHEKIGVIDAQWIVHQTVPSLGNQGQPENGKAPWEGVRERCKNEWTIFQERMNQAEKAYYQSIGVTLPYTTH